MKIAYLTSMYPNVSHTFILREILALRARGVEIVTFSVRRPTAQNILGAEAAREAKATRWLVPPPARTFARALLWGLASRPLLSARTLVNAVTAPGIRLRQRIKWFYYFAEAVLLAYWLVTERCDRLHGHFGNSGSSTALLAARLAGVPFSFTCHGSELLEPDIFRLADKVAVADFVACVSEYGRAQLMRLSEPSHYHKLHVVRCGLPSPPVATPCKTNRSSEILCVARLSPEKGHLVLLEALVLLRDRNTDFHCTLVGDGPMRSTIEAKLTEWALTDRVCLTGSLPPDEVTSRYQQAGVVVLPSFSEGVPVVLMEALACARPVVATCVGGVPELIEHNTRGLLVTPSDADALADALQRVLQDPEWASRLAQAGAEFVWREFDLEVSARRLAELFGQTHRG